MTTRPTNIAAQPHYEIHSTELAKWVERGGPNQWWTVGDDTYLNSRIHSPCRGDDLATVLRRTNRSLLVYDPQLRPDAKGQPITAAELDALTDRMGPAVFEAVGQPVPGWAN